MFKFWITMAAVNGFMSVSAGAFGAHVLKKKLSADMFDIFEVGARYQMYHALALLAVAWLAYTGKGSLPNAAGWCFLGGIVIFSGSLYVLSLSGFTRLGMVTPIGGVLFLTGWILLAIAGYRLSG